MLVLLIVKLELMVLGGTMASENRLVKKKKEIKIVQENDSNYTFLEMALTDITRNSEDDSKIKTITKIEKDVLKTRSIDSKKSKIRFKNRIAGGHNQQGHSSVYE